jgi:hypothetical protein
VIYLEEVLRAIILHTHHHHHHHQVTQVLKIYQEEALLAIIQHIQGQGNQAQQIKLVEVTIHHIPLQLDQA